MRLLRATAQIGHDPFPTTETRLFKSLQPLKRHIKGQKNTLRMIDFHSRDEMNYLVPLQNPKFFPGLDFVFAA